MAIYEHRWHGVARGCRDQSHLRAFDVFYPLAKCIWDLSWDTMADNYRRDEDFWVLNGVNAF